METSTFVLFLVLMGLALTSNNQTLFYIGIGVGALFLITMGGSHHLIVAITAVAIIWFVGLQNILKLPESQGMLASILISAALFAVFVLHGKESSGGQEGYPLDMGSMGLPTGY